MSIFHATILGAVQGLTEFLPISSSGHLILVPYFFGWNVQSLAFDTVLHLGTLLALVIYFFKDLLDIAKNINLLKVLIVGSIPAGIIGFFLDSFIESIFRSTNSVAIFLMLGSLIMIGAELTYKKVWQSDRINDIAKISTKKGFFVGLFQALALFSGVSRSGSTISGGMLLGLSRELAARFSFILSIPIVFGASLYKVLKSYQELNFDLSLLAGFLSSFLVGMLAISFLIKFLKKNTLTVFVIYRLLLVAVLFLFI